MNIKTRGLTTTKAMRGYTIVEVMIFVVVSGGLLLSVLGLISGQQQKTRFKTGVYDFESTIQDLVNDVETGYYPNAGTPGSDKDHIYLGKAVQFYRDSSGEVNRYKHMTIQGNAKTGAPPKDVTDLSEADPQGRTDLVGTGNLLNGVELTKVIYRGASPTESFGFAVVSGISSNGKKSSGSKGQLAKIDISNVENDILLDGAIETLDRTSPSTPIQDASQGLLFCLREGGGGRIAAVTLIGGGTTTYFDTEAEGQGCSG